MTLTFLGTGTSQGVPVIGCYCPVCTSDNPHDKRTRCSILLEGDVTVLVDTTPDLRAQLLRENVNHIDAVVMTHEHSDHVMGFDDLRRFCEMNNGRKVPVHADTKTMERLHTIFHYAFDETNTIPSYLHAEPHLITGSFRLGEMEWTPLVLPHGKTTSLGFLWTKGGQKLGAYLNDCAEVPENVLEKVRDVPVLILDGLRDKPHPTHMTIDEAVETGRRARAGKIYLTHLTHDILETQRSSTLPPNCQIAYDGLKLSMGAIAE